MIGPILEYLTDYFHTHSAAVFFAARRARETGVRHRVYQAVHPKSARMDVWHVRPIEEPREVDLHARAEV